MQVLPLSFALLTYTGFWRPVHWSRNSYKYWMYNVYTVVMLFFVHAFTICGLGDALLEKNLDNFIEKFALFISVLGVSVKLTNLSIRRRSIVCLVNMLLREDCVPRNEEEIAIKRKFDGNMRTLTIYCEILNESVLLTSLMQLNHFITSRTLPTANWTPYDHTSYVAFGISLFHQLLALGLCANASVAHETLISGMINQTSVHLEILAHRIQSIPALLRNAARSCATERQLKFQENRIIGQLVRYHLNIYEFAKRVNATFNSIIFVQFLISSIVLCMSVYRLSSKSYVSLEFLWTGLYLGSMLMQLVLYCWFGDEVTVKSLKIGDAIYETDWTSLSTSAKKNLTFIMARTVLPITVKSAHMFVLSIQLLVKILKVSYTAYNVLQSSKQRKEV